MEDRFYTAAIEVPGCSAREKVLLSAVLDGHGGHVSKQATRHFRGGVGDFMTIQGGLSGR